jgi:membrane protease YdiL (CAAX protease family)
VVVSSRVMLVPMLVSSTIFALAHYGHGPDPIPLFLLAMILGYLYQRTHRIWPSMVLHFTVNFVSMAMLAATLLGR